MSLFKPPSPVLISAGIGGSGGGGGNGTAIINGTSSVAVNVESSSGFGDIQIATNEIVAVKIDHNQNVVIGDPSIEPTSKFTVVAPLGQCMQLNNSTNNSYSNFVVNSDGGLSIATTGNKIQLGTNTLYIGSGALCINTVAVTSSAEQLNYTQISTPGVAVPLKALVVDLNRNISNINSLSASVLTGTLLTPYQPNITSLLSVNINTLSLNGSTVLSTSNEINYLHGITAGSAMEMKALVTDSSFNIRGINAIQANMLTGTIQTAAQPNITSVGTLNALSVNGSIGIGTTAPSKTLEIVSSTPVIRISNRTKSAELSIDMNGNLKINPDMDITISSHTDILFSGTSAISGLDALSASKLIGTIQTPQQPNITSIGTLASLMINGDSIFGTLASPSGSQRIIINESTGQCISLVRSTSLSCSLVINTYGDLEINPTRDLRLISGKGLRMAGPITGVSDLSANTLTGIIQTPAQPNITSIGTLLSLAVTNGITSTSVSATTLTGTLQTASQPNITSIGVLSSLGVTNGISAASVSASTLTGIIQTSFQPNITSIGTLSSLSVTNGITAGTVSASTLTGVIQTSNQTNITAIGTLSTLNVTNTITASSLTASTLTGVLQTSSQPNITTIGTLSSLAVSNGITASSVVASSLTGVIQTASQTNITAIGTLSSLNVSNGIIASSVVASSLTGVIQTALQPNITLIGTVSKLLTTGPIGIGVSTPSCAIDINTSSLLTDPSISFNDGTNTASICLTSTGLNLNTSGTYVTLGTGVGLRFVGGSLIGLSTLTSANIVGTLQTPIQPNITSVGTLSYLDSGYIGLGISHSTSYRLNVLDANGKIAMISDGTRSMIISVINDDYTINTSTNRLALGPDVSLVLNGGTIIGLDNLTASTFTGIIQTPAQPNITSLGTLSSLSVTGRISAAYATISGSARINGDLTIGGALILSTPLSFTNISSSTGTFNANIEAVSSTNGGTLTVTGGAAFSKNVFIGTTLTINGSTITNAMINTITNPTPGTVTSGVFLMADTSNNLTGFNCIYSTNLHGTLKTAYQPNITTVGNLGTLNVSGYLGVGTLSPVKQLEINSTTGDCMRLSYNKPTSAAYLDILVDASGNASLTPSGGTLNLTKIVNQQIILGNTSNSIMPLEVGYAPFVMTGSYAYNSSASGKGVMPAGGTTSYNYSIRACGRILCTQSLDVMSDRRTKKNIIELTDTFCSSFIENTEPVSFNWIDGDENKSFGYIAQDLIKAGFPELVNLAHDENVKEEIDEDGFINPEGVKFTVTYQHIIPILAKNQKRLMQENAELKAKLEAILQLLQRD